MADKPKEKQVSDDDILKTIMNAWLKEDKVSTLPEWAQMQTKIIQRCKANLPDVDEETKKKITREMLLNIRCQSCERARSNECNFSVCIRGLMSGQSYWGMEHLEEES
jgi:hypothetical protein